MCVCTEQMNAGPAFSVWGLDVSSVIDIFHLQRGDYIIRSSGKAC